MIAVFGRRDGTRRPNVTFTGPKRIPCCSVVAWRKRLLRVSLCASLSALLRFDLAIDLFDIRFIGYVVVSLVVNFNFVIIFVFVFV